VPIVDHVLKNNPRDHSVRALIVYPTNALINSQLKAFEDFKQRNWPECPVICRRYTGQDRGEDRDRILTNPPHILLTNYVMLEYMLIRPSDRSLLHQATRALKFLAVDELHVYRGRQGERMRGDGRKGRRGFRRSASPLPARLPISLVPPAGITFTGIDSLGKNTAQAASMIFWSSHALDEQGGLGSGRGKREEHFRVVLDLLGSGASRGDLSGNAIDVPRLSEPRVIEGAVGHEAVPEGLGR
jgi:hypothetical protein